MFMDRARFIQGLVIWGSSLKRAEDFQSEAEYSQLLLKLKVAEGAICTVRLSIV